MTTIIPVIDNSELKEILSEDLCIDLISLYEQRRIKMNGHTISDISLVFRQLTTWLTMGKADLKIPYSFATQRKEPKDHRIWYLSQPRTSKYYNGCFFDLLVSHTDKRTKQIKCKLSDEAIKFFLRYEDMVSKNKSIIEDLL